MAKYKKKRIRELQHDRFRDTTMMLVERLGDRLEGHGRTILYAITGIVIIAVLTGLGIRWSNRKNDEARQALGRGITIASAQVSTVPAAAPTLTFSSEQERAQAAIHEFEKVAAKYGDPFRTKAHYFIATSLLEVDREKGIAQLAELTSSRVEGISTLAKFALAHAKEADANYEEAARLYSELARENSTIVTPQTANLRLAIVYKKQGKTDDAAALLFNVVDASRKARGSDGLPLSESGAAREAATELQKISPERYAQLPPESPASGILF